jgi:lipoyl(octanoyl) transferase
MIVPPPIETAEVAAMLEHRPVRRLGDVVVRSLGVTPYLRCWAAMRAFTDARTPDTPDELWLTEHAPTYTLGLAGRRSHLLRDNGIDVVQVDRGGQVTFHGPGQLVVYVLADLRRLRLGIRQMVRAIEAAVIQWLDSMDISAYGRSDAPGVYVTVEGHEAKVAALGLKVRNGCTYHGLAVNVAMDLGPFADIDPCGFAGRAVTDLDGLGKRESVDTAGRALAPYLVKHLATP